MSELPDELWNCILEIGVSSCRLSHRDLCSLSISSRRFFRLSDDASLWSSLLSRDFPSASSSSHPSPSPKSLYKIRFERDKARKMTAWRLDVLNVESQIAACSSNLKAFRRFLRKEHDRLKAAATEHAHLEQVRQASVALNVWQPDVVRSSQRKMVAQCSVSVESRVNAIEMEIRVCKQQIVHYTNAHKANKQRLHELKKKLASLKYNPLIGVHVAKSSCGRITKRRSK